MRRRTVLIMASVLLTKCFPRKLFAREKIVVYKKNKIPVVRHNKITPPGSQSMAHYTKYCVACQLCAIFCPSNAIKPSAFSHNGLFIPLMDNTEGYCNYNCTLCGEVCPVHAIQPLKPEEKKVTQIGKVKFIKENCIVTLQGTECGACSEHCPTKAVSMVLEGKVRIPHVNENICVGCGACEHICPATPNKAIYVEGNEVHEKIVLPKPGKSVKDDVVEEFPF